MNTLLHRAVISPAAGLGIVNKKILNISKLEHRFLLSKTVYASFDMESHLPIWRVVKYHGDIGNIFLSQERAPAEQTKVGYMINFSFFSRCCFWGNIYTTQEGVVVGFKIFA